MQEKNTTLIGILKRIAFYIALILIWELVYRLGVDVFKIWKSYTFPSPTNVVQSLIILAKTNVLTVAILDSMKRLFLGYGLSLILGTLLGLIIAKFKYLDENLTPLILGLQTLPAALPAIAAGLKQGWSFAWRALIAGEMISASTGLGQVLMVGRDLADISQIAAVMVVIVIIGLFLDKVIFGKLEASIRQRWGLESN